MDFTIITPNLNYGRFLADCLESVASQTCVTLEHLVLDGGSTDDSAEVAARFPHIRWASGKDSGMSGAINRGFNEAKGDWVIWLNADDKFKPGALATMLKILRTTDADTVYGDYDFVDEDGTLLRHMRVPRWSAFVHIWHHCYIPSTAAFYRRSSVIGEGHRLREDFRYVMDGEFYARLHSLGKTFLHVPVNVADFRMHGGNASQRHLEKYDMDSIVAAELQHVESRAIRRAYGFAGFKDPYLTGLVDGLLSITSRGWKAVLKLR
ncbi:MAG: glycosyltransferase [Verrucomicrobiaceae bacterium]|nr:MAG: glycosyltransferase [Verrucomicrobiaceae bacterium]